MQTAPLELKITFTSFNELKKILAEGIGALGRDHDADALPVATAQAQSLALPSPPQFTPAPNFPTAAQAPVALAAQAPLPGGLKEKVLALVPQVLRAAGAPTVGPILSRYGGSVPAMSNEQLSGLYAEISVLAAQHNIQA